MTKTTYNEEEIKQILHALFLEKKKVKELEQQIKQTPIELSQIKDESEDINRLQLMLAALKNKHAEAIQKVSESEQKRQNLIPLKEYEQAQEEIKKLKTENETQQQNLHLLTNNNLTDKKKYQLLLEELNQSKHYGIKLEDQIKGFEEESIALREQQKTLKGLLFAAEENLSVLDQQKKKTDKLNSIVQEKEKKINDLQQYEYGYKKANDKIKELTGLLEKEKDALRPLTAEKEKYFQELTENKQHAEQLERVIKFLRERSEEAQLQAQELQQEFVISQQNVFTLEEQFNEACSEILELGNVLKNEQMEKNDALEEIISIQDQFDELKRKILHFQTEIDKNNQLIHEKDSTIINFEKEKLSLEKALKEKTSAFTEIQNEVLLIKQSLNRALRESKELETRHHEILHEKTVALNKSSQQQNILDKQRNEIYSLKEQISEKNATLERESKMYAELINSQKISNEEHDARLKIAQQHLAKKVKETALLNEELEHLKQTYNEVQKTLDQSKIQVKELTTEIDSNMQQEKKLQAQLHECTLKASEQAKFLEEERSKLIQQVQEHEIQIKALKKYEEKYNQMYSILGNLEKVMESNENFVQPQKNISDIANAKKNISTQGSELHIHTEEKNLPSWDDSKLSQTVSEPSNSEIFKNARSTSITPYKKTLFD